MSGPSFGVTQTLTLLRPAPLDGYGDPTGPPVETPVAGCVIWPDSGGNEQTFQQDTVFVGYAALLPPGTDVLATDQARWGGIVYNIAGEPGRYSNPFSSLDPGVLIALRRAV